MTEFMSDAVRQGVIEARKLAQRRKDRLCVHDGDAVYRVRRFWETGFSVDLDVSDKIRGRVEIYDGARHLYQCLVVGSEVEGDERVFEFKWLTHVTDRPALDFVMETPAPVALISY